MRKLLLYFGLTAILFLCAGCGSGCKKVTDNFMKCMEKQDYDRASAYCGFSKDAEAQEMTINAMLEYFGTNIRTHEIVNDSILPDGEHAIVTIHLTRNNNIREMDVPVFLDRRDGTWYVNPFIREY